MKKLLLSFLLLTITHILAAQVNSEHIWVEGYTRSDGTYVRGHHKTKSNKTVNDNFSTIGNTNPYTGQPGWVPRESEVVYDSYYNYEIPASYVYKSKVEYQLQLVNSLNILTNLLDETYPSEIDRPNWTLNESILYTQLQFDSWEADEEHFAKRMLSLYFMEAELTTGTKDIIDLLMYTGIASVKVKTPNHSFVFTLKEIKESE